MKSHPLAPPLAGTAAAFFGWLLFSYLFSQQVNWPLAISFAAFFGLTYGLLTLIRIHNTLRLQWRLTVLKDLPKCSHLVLSSCFTESLTRPLHRLHFPPN